MNNEDLVKRFHEVKADRTVVQQAWDYITAFVTPYRGKFFEENSTEGSIQWNQSTYNFDSTACNAHSTLSSNLHGALTSPNLQWFTLRFREEKLNSSTTAMRWVENCAARIQSELLDSNFGLEVNEVYQDICGYGTGMMMLEEMPGDGWTGLNFKSIPLKQGYFEEDAMGRVLRFYREIKWTPAQIISKFGDAVPDSVKDKQATGDLAKLSVLFTIYPRNNRIIPLGQKLSLIHISEPTRLDARSRMPSSA